jgi:predicted site-specific integrase-resolvase
MQHKFVNGAMAAQMIGISYKTLKDRFDSGWIVGERTAQGKLKFALDEVERVKKAWQEEKSQYISSTDLNQPETTRSDLEARITELEEEVLLLKMQVAKLHQDQILSPLLSEAELNIIEAGIPVLRTPSSLKHPLPPGCILATHFAQQHGISRSTVREHLDKGKISFESRPKPEREGETERYFTPAQQEEALAYWRARGKIH